MNTFKALHQEDGTVWAVSLMEEAFADEAVFTVAFLECADYRFVSQGDGLISIRALEGTAVYGILESVADYHVPAVRARLLNVGPGIVDDLLSSGETD